MTTEFEHLGLDFTRDLCTAIENYTASTVGLDPFAYVHDGMNLRYAVERHLYIKCVNSAGLFNRYLMSRDVESNVMSPNSLDPLETDIAHFLFRKNLLRGYPRKRTVRWLLGTARSVVKMLFLQLSADTKSRPVDANIDILFNVVNLKFARYLAPVAQKLNPGSFAYLITMDTALGEQLELGGYPIVEFPTRPSAFGNVRYSYPLSHFRPLMHIANATLTALQTLQPKCVVVVEGNAPSDVITSEAAQLLGIPCYCIQQGWSPFVHNGFRNLHFTEMFVWGPRFAELLRPHNPKQLFRVTGNHAIDPCPTPRTAPHAINSLGFFLQAPCVLLSGSSYDAFLELIVSVARSHPQVKVIVREHPSFPLPSIKRQIFENLPNIRFSMPAKESLAHLIASSDMVISVFSTVLLEALAMGVVPLICSIGAMQKYDPDIAAIGGALEVHSVADAHRTIGEVIANPERLVPIRDTIRRISEDFFSHGNAAEAIAARLQQAGNS